MTEIILHKIHQSSTIYYRYVSIDGVKITISANDYNKLLLTLSSNGNYNVQTVQKAKDTQVIFNQIITFK